jgi:hypothetical protein
MTCLVLDGGSAVRQTIVKVRLWKEMFSGRTQHRCFWLDAVKRIAVGGTQAQPFATAATHVSSAVCLCLHTFFRDSESADL